MLQLLVDRRIADHVPAHSHSRGGNYAIRILSFLLLLEMTFHGVSFKSSAILTESSMRRLFCVNLKGHVWKQ